MAAGRSRDARGRVRLSHQSIRDLRKWRDLSRQELSGRLVVPPPPQAAIHSDAADMGYGGTLRFDNLEQGIDGQWHAQGIWDWRDRAHSISYRELKAIRKLLMGHLGHKFEQESVQSLLVHVDNQAVVHITNAQVSASRPMMRDLRKLKLCLDCLGLQIRSEWTPSVANRFADGLWQRFPRGDLQIRRQLRHSVVAGIRAPIDVFKHRTLRDPPVFGRRQVFDELQQPWDKSEVRLLCPPLDLITATLRKLEMSRAPAMLPITDWPRLGWYWGACRMARKVTPLDQEAPDIYLGDVQESESEVAPSASGSELPLSVRAANQLQLANAVIERLGALPNGPGMHKAASLLRDFAWRDRTFALRNSEWKSWVEYRDAARLASMPVSEPI